MADKPKRGRPPKNFKDKASELEKLSMELKNTNSKNSIILDINL